MTCDYRRSVRIASVVMACMACGLVYQTPPAQEALKPDAQDREGHKAAKRNKSDRKRNRANRWR